MNKQLMILAAALAAFAVQHAHAREVYGQIGTEGVGIGYAEPLGTISNVRAEFNGFQISHNFTAGDVHYNAKANLYHGGLYFDLFPAPATVPFRVTAGVLVGGDNVEGFADSIKIHGVTYNAPNDSIHAKIDFPTVRPYIGIGFGHTPVAQKGFSAFFDAGVTYGRPKVSLTAPAEIIALAGQANVDQQKQELQDKADKFRFYPIVKVGVTYRF